MKFASYFLGNQRLGGGLVPLPANADSIAYVCARCGEVWGRILVSPVEPDGSPGDPSVYHIVNRPCEAHAYVGVQDFAERHRAGLFQWWNTDPRATSDMYQAAIPANFPSPVLRREILLMYEHLKRNEDAQNDTSATA